jgi:undecaprenyl-diphosphatase
MFLELLKALFIGIVQGITEWLPVSSTGHMILFDEFVKLDTTPEFKEFFLVVIQLGSILAVLVTFFHKLNPFSGKKSSDEKRKTLALWGKVIIGCIPAGIAGVLLDDWMEVTFYNFVTVAIALLAYGIVFVLLERKWRGREMRVTDLSSLTVRDAFLIGGFQVLSLIPGTSRSGSTILGASILGVGRTAAAEFSFFMALPIMAGASLLKGYKFVASGVGISTTEIGILAVGLVVAFLVSLLAIRFLMDFVRRHSFEAFGWYRIALGTMVLLYWLIAH